MSQPIGQDRSVRQSNKYDSIFYSSTGSEDHVDTNDGNGATLLGVMIVLAFAMLFGFLIGFFVGRM